MQTNLPSTFFTAPPGFGWYIILYFYVGGIGGGALMLAGLLRLFGNPDDRPYIRLASLLALGSALISAFLLTIDLPLPQRFWHMVIQNHTGLPMFKWWSPMSVGVWILMFVGLFAAIASLQSLLEDDWPPVRAFRFIARRPFEVAGAIGGIIFGLGLAGYTGVLLAVTNRPIWSDSSWLGIVFLISAVSTSIAALVLLSRWRRVSVSSTSSWLSQLDRTALILEFVAIVCFLISLGTSVRALLNVWGVLLVFGVILVGIIVPFLLQRRATHDIVLPSALVLLGGFLLRVVVLLSANQIHVVGTQVVR
jgi:formate-dependent nitrite reductase membrane component NrfD